MLNLSVLKGIARITAGPTCRYLDNQWVNYMYISGLSSFSGLSPHEVIEKYNTQLNLNYSVEREQIIPTAEELLTAATDRSLQENKFKCWHLEKITIEHERLLLLFRRHSRHSNKNGINENCTISAHLIIECPVFNITVHTYSPDGIEETICCEMHTGLGSLGQPINIDCTITKRGSPAPSTTITYHF